VSVVVTMAGCDGMVIVPIATTTSTAAPLLTSTRSDGLLQSSRQAGTSEPATFGGLTVARCP
jgi:hypothetical protein